jgi:alpha-N-acetylglucosamine transferase
VKSGLFILVDILAHLCYNVNMNLEKPSRKKRTDRTHIIYELRVNGLSYIGVTAKTEVLVHETLRGKADAHKRERELIKLFNPELNTDKRGM